MGLTRKALPREEKNKLLLSFSDTFNGVSPTQSSAFEVTVQKVHLM
jgi:hypothetical protein